jgi:SAM-dependent methyltransferase
MSPDRTQRLLSLFASRHPAFAKAAERAFGEEPGLFRELAEPMLEWAEALLGPEHERVLLDGYAEFVVDVNRCQWHYERSGRYAHQRYAEVFEATYNDPAFMESYHWGVYATTFLWRHHLEIYRLFRDSFLARLARGAGAGRLLDLGCGSGIWHLLFLRRLPAWQATAVDISETSIATARGMAEAIGRPLQIRHVLQDALTFQVEEPLEAAVSCFLMEHLERPQDLLCRLAQSLIPGGLAFVTCALTAAETDHIFEMRRESEPIELAEAAGFRVLACVSAAPDDTPAERRFLPRSMALVLQRRRGEIW